MLSQVHPIVVGDSAVTRVSAGRDGRIRSQEVRANEPNMNAPLGPAKHDSVSTSSTKTPLSLKDVGEALSQRSQQRRYKFWVRFLSCILRVLWNLASPLKSYLLSFYGLPGDDLVFSYNVNWTMEVDYEYARALYDTSGVNYTAPVGKPIRFINMYLDFVVFNRASKWAKYIDDFQQDPYVGLFCRTSLVSRAAVINKEIDGFCNSQGLYRENGMIEQQSCRVNEVSEAVMCLKGINVLALLNYEWQSSFDPTNEYVQKGARLYQDEVFPHLDACLQRRAYLFDKLGRDEALQQLTQELAANFSLDPIGYGGKKGLYADYYRYEGFTDLSGKLSGTRLSRMSGSLPERTQPMEPDLNALVLGRERLWWLVGYPPQIFAEYVLDMANYAPFMFMGYHTGMNAGASRFVDGYSVAKAKKIGYCQLWELKPTANKLYPAPVYSDMAPVSSVLTGYGQRYFAPHIVQVNNVTDPEEIVRVSSRLSTTCFARDGCLDLCNSSSSVGWVVTFERSSLCQQRFVPQNVINRQGFVDLRCLGEGTGTDMASLKVLEPVTRNDNTTFEFTRIAAVANPAAIVACVLGGRIPQSGDEPFPNVFFDLINNGANTILTSTFSRGTEKVLENMYALVSLVGCAIFSIWVIQSVLLGVRTIRRINFQGLCDKHTSAQVLDSIFTSNVSTVAHGRNIQLSKVILYLNLVTWYIGAANINCTWWVDGVDLWTPGFSLKSTDSPYYQCKRGSFIAHLGSFLGIVRLISISYNFKSLTSQHLILRGATRFPKSFLSPVILFGVIPTFVASVTITAINHLRHEWQVLMVIHNQLFMVLLWIAYLFGYHALLQQPRIGRLYVELLCKLNICSKQKVRPGTVAAALIGPYYLTLPEQLIPGETEWIPLSVAMETAAFDVDNLDFAARKYSLTGLGHNDVVLPDQPIPQWVLESDEYFFS